MRRKLNVILLMYLSIFWVYNNARKHTSSDRGRPINVTAFLVCCTFPVLNIYTACLHSKLFSDTILFRIGIAGLFALISVVLYFYFYRNKRIKGAYKQFLSTSQGFRIRSIILVHIYLVISILVL